MEELVVDEGVFGLKNVKFHVGLQSLGLNEVIGSSTIKHETSVVIQRSRAAREQKIYGFTKLLFDLHYWFG
ncbi:Holliday junction branch migration DNA-helicase [Sesbania bispinosa]|nr:Holliday junction branch migration DNA-helicase [Sesbania bispinosa]